MSNNIAKLSFDPKQEAEKLHDTGMYLPHNTGWPTFYAEMSILHKDWVTGQIAMVYEELCVYIREAHRSASKAV